VIQHHPHRSGTDLRREFVRRRAHNGSILFGSGSLRQTQGGSIRVFSPYHYRFRNLVERFFKKLKHFRAIATRFEKHDANYLALVKLAAARIWMRFMSR
jgi:transposase